MRHVAAVQEQVCASLERLLPLAQRTLVLVDVSGIKFRGAQLQAGRITMRKQMNRLQSLMHLQPGGDLQNAIGLAVQQDNFGLCIGPVRQGLAHQGLPIHHTGIQENNLVDLGDLNAVGGYRAHRGKGQGQLRGQLC